MESIVRALAVYLFLMLVMRISGRRTLAQITVFDLVLLLVISEAVQNAMVGENYSLTNAFVLVLTLVGADIALSLLKQRSRWVARLIDDVPLVIVEDGRPLEDRMRRSRVDAEDVMEAARELQGLERMEQIKYAVLERSGTITIIPKG
ncbi:MAG: DUF421 domain-containing protein [Meiothermus sp.]|nr:DUF421 domain-containing protein [Meiothermus sp.]